MIRVKLPSSLLALGDTELDDLHLRGLIPMSPIFEVGFVENAKRKAEGAIALG